MTTLTENYATEKVHAAEEDTIKHRYDKGFPRFYL